MKETGSRVELEARIAALERRLADMEERTEPKSVFDVLDRIVPADVRAHMRAARKEQLLAVRALLDRMIERQEREAADTPRRRESITVE